MKKSLEAHKDILCQIAPEKVVNDMINFYNQSGIDENKGISPIMRAAYFLYLLCVCAKSSQDVKETVLNLKDGNVATYVDVIYKRILHPYAKIHNGNTINDLREVNINENYILLSYISENSYYVGHPDGDGSGQTYSLSKNMFLKYLRFFVKYE